MTLSVPKWHLAARQLHKPCVCCNTHLMRQGPGRGEEKPGGRRLCSRQWKWVSALLRHRFLSFNSLFLSSVSSVSVCLHPVFLFFHVYTLLTLPLQCICLPLSPSIPLHSIQTVAAFVPLLFFSTRYLPSAPPPSLLYHLPGLSFLAISLLCLAYLPRACIVIQRICYRLCCSGSQFWALGPAVLPIFIPAF